ncbi:hypothetical protein ACOCEA_01505 [Maribacter sp. CXY002]|uniref:hypothetical protein n=1 Tax=Maribacter luteocoastalis TaxID=3407671 RepID=UPI003B673847
MKKIIYLFLFASGFIQGQTIGNGDGITTDTQAGIVIKEVPINGSVYINDLYKKGTTLINDISKTDALMRYDAFHDAVEILDENGTARKLLRRKQIKAIFDGKTYEVVEYQTGEKTKLGYFNPLNEGRTQLYFKPKKTFIQAEKPDNGYDTYTPPHYKDISAYYVKTGESPAQEVKLNMRSILKIIGDGNESLKQFIIDYNLNLKKVEDIIRLIEYHNTFDKETKITHEDS